MEHKPDLQSLRDALAAKIETRQDWHEKRIRLTAGQLHELVIGILNDELRLRKLERPADVES